MGLACCVASGVIALSAIAGDTDRQTQLELALSNLRNSDAEWRREEGAYRAQRRSGSMSATEAEEYAEFVATLHRQKLEDCEAARKIGGARALKNFDCIKPVENWHSIIALPPKANTAKTESEKIDALEAKLKRLEAEVDEELLRKQQAIRQNALNRSSNRGNGTGSANGGFGANRPQGNGSWGDPPGPADRRGERGTESDAPVTGQPPESSPGKNNDVAGRTEPGKEGAAVGSRKSSHYDPGAGPGIEKKQPPPPNAVGPGEDGSDDDVVLRQIREAAERETDPVLQKKLWEEYRKLKASRE